MMRLAKKWVTRRSSNIEHCHMPMSLGENMEATHDQKSLRKEENQEGVTSYKSISRNGKLSKWQTLLLSQVWCDLSSVGNELMSGTS